jgi:hypothetical protein
MTTEEFLALEPRALRAWLEGRPADEIISTSQDGSSCPLAVFAHECGLTEAHVGKWRFYPSYRSMALEDVGVALPTWMQMFVGGVDRMPKPPITAGQALAIMDEIDALLEG